MIHNHQIPPISQQIQPYLIQQTDQHKIIHQNLVELIAIVAAISITSSYYGWVIVQLSSVPNEVLKRAYGDSIVEPVRYGALLASIPGGAFVGALLSRQIMSRTSRRQFLLKINLLVIIVEIACQLPNFYMLMGCRLLKGLCVGMYLSIIPIYIYELTPKSIAGSLGAFTGIYLVLGNIFCFLLAYIFNAINFQGALFWRLAWGTILIPVILQTILIFIKWIPESPNSLIKGGKMDDAKQIIRRFHIQFYVEDVINAKVFEVSVECQNRENSKNEQQNGERKQAEWLSKQSAHWSTYLIAFEVPVLCQLVGLASVSVEGGKIISVYWEDVGKYLPILLAVSQLISSVISTMFLKYVGRRPVLLFGNASFIFINLGLAVGFYRIGQEMKLLVVLLMILHLFMNGLTVATVAWLYVPEIIAANLVPSATTTNWMGSLIFLFVTPIIVDSCGQNPYLLFLIFSILSTITFLINLKWLKETKGLAKQQIIKRFHSQ